MLSFVLGDGCLHYFKRSSGIYGGLTIDHGIAQADYQSWKAAFLSEITGRKTKMRTGHRGNSVQLNICMKRLRAWRKFCYPNNRKSISKILPFIRHPEFALCIWLMDDGYVESSFTKNKNYSASLRIFSCDATPDELVVIRRWFMDNFQIDIEIRYQKKYPFMKIYSADSLRIWSMIRSFVLRFKSMQYKFRYIEQIFQSRSLQRLPSQKLDDIVRITGNSE